MMQGSLFAEINGISPYSISGSLFILQL
jgi:hypothetical protein